MKWFIAMVMTILPVASLIISAISVIATGNTILIIVWFAGLLTGFINVGLRIDSTV